MDSGYDKVGSMQLVACCNDSDHQVVLDLIWQRKHHGGILHMQRRMQSFSPPSIHAMVHCTDFLRHAYDASIWRYPAIPCALWIHCISQQNATHTRIERRHQCEKSLGVSRWPASPTIISAAASSLVAKQLIGTSVPLSHTLRFFSLPWYPERKYVASSLNTQLKCHHLATWAGTPEYRKYYRLQTIK